MLEVTPVSRVCLPRIKMKPTNPCAAPANIYASRAFTLVELLATLAGLALIGMLMATALAGARDGSQTAQCLNNHRQLISAWLMYADDNNGNLVLSTFSGTTTAGTGWAAGWLDWSTSSDNTNVLLLISEKYSLTAKYLNRNAPAYQCPADTQVGLAQRMRGWTRRVRSYSATGAVAINKSPLPGPGPSTTPVLKLSELVDPPPSQTFIYIEEHAESINDAAFALPNASSMVDVPASRHNGACAVTFADGHSEVHHWSARALQGVLLTPLPPMDSGRFVYDPDTKWLSSHSPKASLRR